MAQKVDRSRLSPDELDALEMREREEARSELGKIMGSIRFGGSVQLPNGLTDRATQLTTKERVVRKENERLDEIRKFQRTESISIPVGNHTGCGGEIWYESHFQCVEKDIRNFRIGGYNPIEEITKCSCKMCGQLFDPELPLYRNQVTAYRNRPPK